MTTSDFQQMKGKYNGTIPSEPPDGEIQTFLRPKYTFHSNFRKKIPSKVVTTKAGRYYTTPDGNKYPSITTVLGKTKSQKDVEKLEKWKKKLGHEAAAKELTRAANRGTALHKLCEDFLEYPGEEFNRPWDKSIKLFKQIHPLLSRIGEVHVIEGVLYSDILRVAGRCDLIATFDDKVSVIDFKGSTKPKEPEWINDYFIQETFYGVAYGALYAPCKVEQIVTIIAVESTGENQIFIRNPQDYVLQLFNRIKQNHNG
jgi:hypothetical protein